MKIEQTAQRPQHDESRLPSLDGWRAASILMVLGFHATWAAGLPDSFKPVLRSIFDGDLGVRCFFIISGFLITWLMILETTRAGSVSLRAFYARRCLRILPVYIGFLCVLGALQLIGAAEQSSASWLGNLTFTRNFWGEDPISEHLWSLSVEEQFYLLWPAAFLFFGGSKNAKGVMLILLAAIIAAPLFRAANYGLVPNLCKPLFYYNSFCRRCDSLAFGCASAIVYARQRSLIESYFLPRPWLIATCGIGLVCLPYVLAWYFVGIMPVANSLQAIGICILILHSVANPKWGFYQILNWRWVRQIGLLSYSIYIWQQLFWTPPANTGLSHIWWLGIWVIPVFGTAIISHYFLERPFLKLRARHRVPLLTEKQIHHG